MTLGAEVLRERDARRAVPCLDLAEWADRFGVVAGITTRHGGFNLGLLTPDPAADVVARWRSFAAAVSPAFGTLTAGLQVHGREVARHVAAPRGWVIRDGVDGHATRDPGILCCVSVADCVPVYLADPTSGAAALLHAGWRGVAGGVLEAGIRALLDLGAGAPADIVMHCGVSICEECYEVGSEVLEAVTGSAAQGPGRLNLRGVLVARARAAGIGEVSVSPWCTAHDRDRFFSHRRSGGADGRMLAYLGRPIA